MSDQHSRANANGTKSSIDSEQDREVLRCIACGLVQYRARVDHCRRCLRMLPLKAEFIIPPMAPQDLSGDDRQIFEKRANGESVENIGQRVRQLREFRGMTQSYLQICSNVSRSYLSRIESGQMTPSVGTLEKISDALGVGLNRFFVQEFGGETLFDDPFICGLRPYLRQLDVEQWQCILERLQAIRDYVTSAGQIRAMPPAPPSKAMAFMRPPMRSAFGARR